MSKHELSDDPLDLGRFSEPGLLVMVSLCDGPKHGYAMTQDIALFSGATLGPGTLYGTLARLEDRGLIEPLPMEERRRLYRLTSIGNRAVRQRLAQLTRLTDVARRRLVET